MDCRDQDMKSPVASVGKPRGIKFRLTVGSRDDRAEKEIVNGPLAV
jgi:hypothetical protein